LQAEGQKEPEEEEEHWQEGLAQQESSAAV
jgi:hypothetical protein